MSGQGADELRVKSLLVKNGVGPDAEPGPAIPPKPTQRPRDWLDDILDQPATPPEPDEEPEDTAESAPQPRPWWAHRRPQVEKPSEPEPGQEQEQGEARPRPFEPQPGYWPHPHMPSAFTAAPERAAAAISAGTRRFLYNASAAGAGWLLGLYSKFAWALNDCSTTEGVTAGLVLGIGGSLLIAHVWDRRTRHWWPGIAWAARIPLATAILALALWAPAT